jgi:hypothetical protein
MAIKQRLSGGITKTVASPKKRFNQVEEVLGVKYLNRVDPDEDFSDVDGDLRGEFALDNEQPDRHYHWAHNDPNDIGAYKGGLLKYRVEYYEEGNVMARMHAEHAMWQKRNRFEHIQTRKTNDRMFKKKQRDLDLRAFVDGDGDFDRDSFRSAIAEDAADPRGA